MKPTYRVHEKHQGSPDWLMLTSGIQEESDACSLVRRISRKSDCLYRVQEFPTGKIVATFQHGQEVEL